MQATLCGAYEPAGCVVGCEQKPWGGAACYPAVDVWLACLESHRSEIACGAVNDDTIAACYQEKNLLTECAVLVSRHLPSGAK